MSIDNIHAPWYKRHSVCIISCYIRTSRLSFTLNRYIGSLLTKIIHLLNGQTVQQKIIFLCIIHWNLIDVQLLWGVQVAQANYSASFDFIDSAKIYLMWTIKQKCLIEFHSVKWIRYDERKKTKCDSLIWIGFENSSSSFHF